jgi:hypothetical protein
MRKLFIVLMGLVILFTSCSKEDLFMGEGTLITKEISIDIFDGIESYGNNNVTIFRGEVQKVEVTGYSNIIDRLLQDVDNGIWKIELKNGRYKNGDLTINIILPIINEVSIHGSGEILVNDNISDANMKVSIYGSGEIRLNKNNGCENLDVIIEGSGNVKTYAEFEDLIDLNIETLGSGGFDGFSLSSKTCDISIEGSSQCQVSVEEVLKVKLEGSGVINYKGNPTITTSITGSGQVNNSN